MIAGGGGFSEAAVIKPRNGTRNAGDWKEMSDSRSRRLWVVSRPQKSTAGYH